MGVAAGTRADGTVCNHEGETSTYCTQCWINLHEARTAATSTQTPLDRATFLVKAANIYAFAADTNLRTVYPPLAISNNDINPDWDFFGTVAGVSVAFATIADTVPDADQAALCYAVARSR